VLPLKRNTNAKTRRALRDDFITRKLRPTIEVSRNDNIRLTIEGDSKEAFSWQSHWSVMNYGMKLSR
jgi:hypothetical protein